MLDYIRKACLRHDTVVAMAFRRALGISHRGTAPSDARRHAAEGVYDGMHECFENRKRVNL